jgi:chromosome segregation ATPase
VAVLNRSTNSPSGQPGGEPDGRDGSGPNGDAALERELASLRSDYERLREDKVRTEQNLANLRQQLDELRRRAEAEYGTADPDELERLLADKRTENTRLIEEYRAHITAVRRSLEEIERGQGS